MMDDESGNNEDNEFVHVKWGESKKTDLQEADEVNQKIDSKDRVMHIGISDVWFSFVLPCIFLMQHTF